MDRDRRGIILVVDDVESEIDILVDILDRKYEVAVATDGQSALEIAHEVCPDLILLDILMPGMDGYEVCRRLKEDTLTRHVPVIFVTVLEEEGYEARGLELGALDYITKPFNRDIVLARVRNHMELIEAHRLKEDVNRIMRHDMRNELSMIIGYPDILLERSELPPSHRKMIERIRASGYNLLNMINLGLQLYKMEEGLYDYHPHVIDLVSTLERLLENKSALVQAKHVSVDLRIEGSPVGPGDSLTISGEDLLCYSMFSNLVTNAIEASPAGETVSIELSVKNGNARVAIRNKGAVPADIRDRFFDKYTTSGKINGTGLGTYSALLMAKTHGGTIEMTTSESTGTCVTVNLPI